MKVIVLAYYIKGADFIITHYPIYILSCKERNYQL